MTTIAQTLLTQLGSVTLKMLGASGIVALENGLQFSIGRNAKSVNKLVILLDPSDLYTVQAWNINTKRKNPADWCQMISEESGLYADQLHASITYQTGMDTTL